MVLPPFLSRQFGAASLLLALLLFLAASAVCGSAEETPFRDVPAGHWARDALVRLAERGVLSGYGDNSFRGEEPVTRYSLAVILARALEQIRAQPGGPEAREGRISSGLGGMALADREDLRGLIREFRSELEMLGVKSDAVLEKLELQGRELRGLTGRVERLEQGEDHPIRFEGGELRLAGFNRAARTSLVDAIAHIGVHPKKGIVGRLDLRWTTALDGGRGERWRPYEAFIDVDAPFRPVRHLRAGRFFEGLGEGLVLYDRVEALRFTGGYRTQTYRLFFGEDVLMAASWPLGGDGEIGYYYLSQGPRSAPSRPTHRGVHGNVRLGARLRFGVEFADFDDGRTRLTGPDEDTRGFLGRLDYSGPRNRSLSLLYAEAGEDFRAYRIDTDLAYHSDASSPLEDVLQALQTSRNNEGRGVRRDDLAGFRDLRAEARTPLRGGPWTLAVALDHLTPSGTRPGTGRSAFDVWHVKLSRPAGEDGRLELRWRQTDFENPSSLSDAGGLQVTRSNRGEVRAQYFLRF